MYDHPEYEARQARVDQAYAAEAKARKAFYKADNTLAVDDPRLGKARAKLEAAAEELRAANKALAELVA